MNDAADEASRQAARWLLTAGAVRQRSATLFERIASGRSDRFSFVPDALPGIADEVASLTRERFPDLAVPIHSRFRHFEAGGYDRFASLATARQWKTREEAARAMADLSIVSVLLDAGAGDTWRYREAATGRTFARSEGLAIASFAMFAAGSFSSVPADPLRADAQALAGISGDEFASAFQLGPENWLAGADGRRALLERLAAAVRARPDIFAVEDDPRPGGIVDALAADADGGELPAARILEVVLEGLGAIWPSRIELAGIPLGDTWPHPAFADSGPEQALFPFHKLSTWLTYSLLEPLTVRGLRITYLDALPPLAEYRNGGLLVDGGALVLREPSAGPLTVADPLVVEWRAATVTLIDRLAPLVRDKLGAGPAAMPLASILEGGTWLAGRKLAKAARAGGGPPIAIVSDGTVF